MPGILKGSGAVLALAAALTLSACWRPAPAAPILVGLLLRAEGDQATGLRGGFQLAVHDLNAAGGYRGQKVQTAVVEIASDDFTGPLAGLEAHRPPTAVLLVGADPARAQAALGDGGPPGLLLLEGGRPSGAGFQPAAPAGLPAVGPYPALDELQRRRWRLRLLAAYGELGAAHAAVSSYNATQVILGALLAAGPGRDALTREITRRSADRPKELSKGATDAAGAYGSEEATKLPNRRGAGRRAARRPRGGYHRVL